MITADLESFEFELRLTGKVQKIKEISSFEISE